MFLKDSCQTIIQTHVNNHTIIQSVKFFFTFGRKKYGFLLSGFDLFTFKAFD